MPASVVAFAGVLLSMAARSGQEVRAELEKLQGTWVCIAARSGGKPIRADLASWRLTIEGRNYTRTSSGGRPYQMQLLSMDPWKSPKRIELRDHPDMPRESPLDIPGRYACVYEIDGDTLKQCIGNPPKFPAKMDKDSPKYAYFEFKRMKKK